MCSQTDHISSQSEYCTKFVLEVFAALGGFGMTESIEFGLLVLKSPELVNLPGYRAGRGGCQMRL